MIVDPLIWFSEREVEFIPKHFIKCTSKITNESKKWIYNKSQGRFALTDSHRQQAPSGIISSDQNVYFEDQKDAMMFELLWADTK
jgi:hypothetical protein